MIRKPPSCSGVLQQLVLVHVLLTCVDANVNGGLSSQFTFAHPARLALKGLKISQLLQTLRARAQPPRAWGYTGVVVVVEPQSSCMTGRASNETGHRSSLRERPSPGVSSRSKHCAHMWATISWLLASAAVQASCRRRALGGETP